jgi:pimeloyl-ACP methyl ester carboxylesterase
VTLSYTRFTPSHRGGAGSPMVCIHGFTDTWRTWELVLPALEQRHEVLAPTLPGHAGGAPLAAGAGDAFLADAVEEAMDEAGFERAHLVGNSLGGYLALQLAARGRAQSVVALAPAGGWAAGDDSFEDTLDSFLTVQDQLAAAIPHLERIVASEDGRRRSTEAFSERFEHLPPELIAHLMCGAAACRAAEPLIAFARQNGWSIDAEHIECPVRIVWGASDRLLPWPSAAARYRQDWLPHADWVELDGVGHCPQLDVPLEAAQLILGFTGAQAAHIS